MIKFDQQEPDDCFRACLYTIFGKDFGWNVSVTKAGSWNPAFLNLVAQAGIMVDYFPTHDRQPWFPSLVIASGLAQRGHRHAVVFSINDNRDRMIHDPHPSRSGLIAQDGWYVARMIQ